MRKLQLPSGSVATPQLMDAIKDNIEVITGKKGGRIATVAQAASTPTQAEFNALVTAFNALLARLQD